MPICLVLMFCIDRLEGCKVSSLSLYTLPSWNSLFPIILASLRPRDTACFATRPIFFWIFRFSSGRSSLQNTEFKSVCFLRTNFFSQYILLGTLFHKFHQHSPLGIFARLAKMVSSCNLARRKFRGNIEKFKTIAMQSSLSFSGIPLMTKFLMRSLSELTVVLLWTFLKCALVWWNSKARSLICLSHLLSIHSSSLPLIDSRYLDKKLTRKTQSSQHSIWNSLTLFETVLILSFRPNRVKFTHIYIFRWQIINQFWALIIFPPFGFLKLWFKGGGVPFGAHGHLNIRLLLPKITFKVIWIWIPSGYLVPFRDFA